MGVTIIRTGMAVPETCITNDDLATVVDTNDEWIKERTGVSTRYVAKEETAVDLATAAIKKAFGSGPDAIDPASIDLLIVSTITPDMIVPGMGCLIKKGLNLENAIAFDINAACSGFVYALWLAESLMKTGKAKRAIIVGVERLTRLSNYEDRSTCILFGDGAGCAIIELDESKRGIIGSYIKNYDDVSESITCGMEYRKIPFADEPSDVPQYLYMAGKQVFKFAVTAMGDAMDKVLKEANVSPDDVKYYVPHQANMRIIKAAAQRFNQPLEKFQIVIDKVGNVSAASIPMALATLYDTTDIKPGELIMLVGFGGGLSAAAMLVEAV